MMAVSRTLGLLLLAAAVALGGCMLPQVAPNTVFPSANRLPAGRVLIVAKHGGDGNRPIVEAATELLLGALRSSGDVVGARELVTAAEAAGRGAWALRLVERAQRGLGPDPGELDDLVARLSVMALITVEVIAYDQVWAGDGKATRVAVEAHAVGLPGRETLWRVRGVAEVEDKRGFAFRYATELAVLELAHAIDPRHPLPAQHFEWPWSTWRR